MTHAPQDVLGEYFDVTFDIVDEREKQNVKYTVMVSFTGLGLSDAARCAEGCVCMYSCVCVCVCVCVRVRE